MTARQAASERQLRKRRKDVPSLAIPIVLAILFLVLALVLVSALIRMIGFAPNRSALLLLLGRRTLSPLLLLLGARTRLLFLHRLGILARHQRSLLRSRARLVTLALLKRATRPILVARLRGF